MLIGYHAASNLCRGHTCSIYYVGVDESVDGAAFLDLSEDDVKTMVKPLGHVKRVLQLLSSVKTKVIIPSSCLLSKLLCMYNIKFYRKLCHHQVICYLLKRWTLHQDPHQLRPRLHLLYQQEAVTMKDPLIAVLSQLAQSLEMVYLLITASQSASVQV